MSDTSDSQTTTPPEPTMPSSRSRSSRSSNSANSNNPPTYGYHNTFHTHATLPPPFPPPTYDTANSEKVLGQLDEKARAESEPCALPAYTCTVEASGELGMKPELASPFQIASNREWQDTYVVLQGTQLNIYRVKYPHPFSKTKTVGPGRLIKSFSLQHGEVGVAGDFKKTRPIPKSPFAHLIPSSARQKLYETDPHLFEPVREHAIRLRLETEQFLLCAPSQEDMLDWVEKLCAAVDISPPLEDRSEPRYRSLPRRHRRQRMLDGGRLADIENLLSLDGGRMIIAEQERIIRRLYPHLAGTTSSEASNETSAPNCQAAVVHTTADPETDDLDPEDVRFPTARRTASTTNESDERPSSSATTDSSPDPKSSPPHSHSPAQALRYRRRCAPVLLANSPRVSDVVFSNGKRMRINTREHTLINLVPLPPRYDVHNFPKQKALPKIVEQPAAKATPAPLSLDRPSAPARSVTNDSFISFGYDLSSTSSSEHHASSSDTDDIRPALLSSEPPSPTLASRAKADAAATAGRMMALRKERTSEERARDEGLSAVALGVGLLI